MKKMAYIVTGPTSGIGRAAALELAQHGPIILVGRSRAKLKEMQRLIERKFQTAYCIQCDLAEPESVRRAVAEIIALDLPIAGLLNNAGIMQTQATKNSLGWDMSFATNHLGPFAFTEALIPHLADGTNVLFVGSAVEDPERKPAKAVGFRGGRYISAEACARGEWLAGGSKIPGADAYATSKQCNLATVLAFAKETPRLHFRAIEPGISLTTGLGGGSAPLARVIARFFIAFLVPVLMPFLKYLSTPEKAGRVITKIMLDKSNETGIYYDETGHHKLGSEQVRNPQFYERVVKETRDFLAAHTAASVK